MELLEVSVAALSAGMFCFIEVLSPSSAPP